MHLLFFLNPLKRDHYKTVQPSIVLLITANKSKLPWLLTGHIISLHHHYHHHNPYCHQVFGAFFCMAMLMFPLVPVLRGSFDQSTLGQVAIITITWPNRAKLMQTSFMFS